MPSYRIELHRPEGIELVGHTNAVDARQRELSSRAARLAHEGATGTLVLVDPTSGKVVARRHLGANSDRLALVAAT